MIEQLIREERRTPVAGKCDVLVLGGGLAGVSAAVAAARLGKQVTLLEKSIALGGLATLGHVCVYLPICDGQGNRARLAWNMLMPSMLVCEPQRCRRKLRSPKG